MAILKTPKDCVTVRMYRQGHGDCFLLAFPTGKVRPYFVLIDCGYKPGSENFLPNKDFINIVNNIGEATDFTIDLVIVTHEHQDHVNGFWKKNDPYFGEFEIKESWFAWTEDPSDKIANKLRRKHRDQLIGLIEARNMLGMSNNVDGKSLNRIDSLLGLEIGGEGNDDFDIGLMRLAATEPAKQVNKLAMKLIKDKSREHLGVRYLRPGELKTLPTSAEVNVYVIGPPRDENLLTDEDPVGDESFPLAGSTGLSFTAAVNPNIKTASPFRREYCIESKNAFGHGFFKDFYGEQNDGINNVNEAMVSNNAEWRRIDYDWLASTENLAIKLNRGTNNTSLVLAFELPKTKKVLLFVGDAQRGNWISWGDVTWSIDQSEITTKDLLSRTVLYKVGHHGSHNATLNGSAEDTYANLSWMAQDQNSEEFTAMITAVNEWAMTKNNPPWRHPLPSIKEALIEKTQGRVFQTDSDLEKPDDVPNTLWKKFMSRVVEHELYFDYKIFDK
jgi:hypothetical protein